MLGAAVAASAFAMGATNVQAKDPYEGLGLIGSSTLVTFAYSNPYLPAEARQVRNEILTDMGILGRKFQITSSWIRFAPILTYDRNINGGSTGSVVKIGGLDFYIDPEERALSGALAGVSMNSGLRTHIAPRTALELDLSSRFAWSPQHEIAKTSVYGSACVKHALSYATYVNGCVDAQHSGYHLGNTARLGASAGISRAFVAKSALHEAGFNIEQNRHLNGGDDKYNQSIASVSYKVAPGGPLALFAGAQFGTNVSGRNTMREQFYAGATRKIFDRPITFSISAQNNRGGFHLGEKRKEQTWSASISGPVNEKLSASVSYSKTLARQDFYDDDALGFNADFRW